MVNQSHYQRIQNLLQSAVADGAKVVSGGQAVDNQQFIAPTLLTDVSTDSTIMQQEIFGPVLPIMTYSNTDDVIAFINDNPKPLALYLFSSDKKFNAKVLQETSAGDTCINATMLHIIHHNLPFGGVNNSGIGKSGGYWGYMAFSHERSVLEDKFSSAAKMYPPYTDSVKKLIKMSLKLLS